MFVEVKVKGKDYKNNLEKKQQQAVHHVQKHAVHVSVVSVAAVNVKLAEIVMEIFAVKFAFIAIVINLIHFAVYGIFLAFHSGL